MEEKLSIQKDYPLKEINSYLLSLNKIKDDSSILDFYNVFKNIIIVKPKDDRYDRFIEEILTYGDRFTGNLKNLRENFLRVRESRKENNNKIFQVVNFLNSLGNSNNYPYFYKKLVEDLIQINSSRTEEIIEGVKIALKKFFIRKDVYTVSNQDGDNFEEVEKEIESTIMKLFSKSSKDGDIPSENDNK